MRDAETGSIRWLGWILAIVLLATPLAIIGQHVAGDGDGDWLDDDMETIVIEMTGPSDGHSYGCEH